MHRMLSHFGSHRGPPRPPPVQGRLFPTRAQPSKRSPSEFGWSIAPPPILQVREKGSRLSMDACHHGQRLSMYVGEGLSRKRLHAVVL